MLALYYLCLNIAIDVIIYAEFRFTAHHRKFAQGSQSVRSMNNKNSVLFEYIGPIPESDTLHAAVDEIWAEAMAESPLLLPKSPGSKKALLAPPFDFKRKQGSHPDLATLTVMAGTSGIHLASMALHDLWKRVVLPGLRRLGAAAWRERLPRNTRGRRKTTAATKSSFGTRKSSTPLRATATTRGKRAKRGKTTSRPASQERAVRRVTKKRG